MRSSTGCRTVAVMTNTTQPRTLPTGTAATPRERWNRMPKPQQAAVFALMGNDEKIAVHDFLKLTGKIATADIGVAVIRERIGDDIAKLTASERAELLAVHAMTARLPLVTARAHSALDRHGVTR